MNVLDLFSGIGGFSLGLERAGMKTVAFCEIEAYPRAVLQKHWPEVPIWKDVRGLNATELRRAGVGRIDVICGGFPCQDISYAGEGAGLAGARSGLWSEFARLIGDLRPRFAVVENVAALLKRGMGDVLRDLARIGYDAEWSTVSACSVGAPHVRRRVFIVAYPHSKHGWTGLWDSLAREGGSLQEIDGTPRARASWRAWMENPSELYRGADGVPFGMDRNRGIGNAIVSQVPEIIGRAIMSLDQKTHKRRGE